MLSFFEFGGIVSIQSFIAHIPSLLQVIFLLHSIGSVGWPNFVSLNYGSNPPTKKVLKKKEKKKVYVLYPLESRVPEMMFLKKSNTNTFGPCSRRPIQQPTTISASMAALRFSPNM